MCLSGKSDFELYFMPIQIVIAKENPSVSVVVPSRDGYRGGNVPKLIDDIKKQTHQNLELLLAKGITPCSRAHNVGAQSAKGEIVVFFDDDVRLGHNRVIENLIKPLLEDRSIGITGASQLIPPDANWFQRKISQEFSRVQFPVVSTIVESDMATHAALAIRRDVFIKVGRENEALMRGDDPDLRFRVRQAGYKVVVVPQTWVYHPPPQRLIDFLRKSIQSGRYAAYDFWHHPDLIYETPPETATRFVPRRSFSYRILRFIFQNLTALFQCKLIFLFVRTCYGAGYTLGLLREIFLRYENATAGPAGRSQGCKEDQITPI